MPLTDEERKKRKRGNVKCNYCGKGIYRPPSKLKRSKVFYCSVDCHGKDCMTEDERKESRNQSKNKYAQSRKGKIKQKETYLENRPRLLEYKKEWAKKNEDHCRQVAKKYYDTNIETISAKGKIYYSKNKDVMLVRNKDYYNKNKADIKEKHSEYYQNNREHLTILNKEWAANNNDKCIEFSRKYRRLNGDKIRADNQKIRDELGDNYIKKCLCCRSSIPTTAISQELINFKRQQIILTRTIKEIKKCRQ